MFSSPYDSNPFPNFPSSSYPTLPFYIDPENDFACNNTTLLHDPLVVDPFIPSSAHDAPLPEDTLANLAVADCTAILDQDVSNGYGALYVGVPNLVTHKPAAIAKKDRHSKIHTSQGLRDRRVRLSSEIARKFFDLQDMLEFDKPSNTLEWLFTKSESAIKELARSKHSCSSSGEKCSCDPCEPQQGVVHSSDRSLVGGGGDSSSKGRKLKWTQREDVCVPTKKESRDKARARARERTCYKMNNNNSNNNNNNNGRVQNLEERYPATANTAQVLHQLRSSLQPELEACVRWPQMVQPYHHLLGGEAHGDDFNNVIEESIMIKRNMKPSLMSSDHDQNLAIPKEASFNNINDYYSFPYSTTNWDTNETPNGCSNLRGIATMNISTCFMNQWEAHQKDVMSDDIHDHKQAPQNFECICVSGGTSF